MASPRNYLSDLRSFYKRRETLSVDFLEELYNKQNGLCALTRVPMTYIRGHGKVPTNISIDRIDSCKGYEPDNVQLVCSIVNIMKSNLILEDLVSWCEKIVHTYKKDPHS